jgi:hypothetical protein
MQQTEQQNAMEREHSAHIAAMKPDPKPSGKPA